jgi:N utilization substance protein A
LPAFDEDALGAAKRYAYGARSEAAVYVGDLLVEEVPDLGRAAGTLDIVAIARRPGVLTKVAIRARAAAPMPVATGIGIGADHIARVRERLDGERIHVVAWQRSASAYIANALGLGEIPPVLLLAGIGHARVLLGEIDVRGIAGWRGLNTLLASALTGWRIRLEPVAATAAWSRLQAAMLTRRAVTATVVGHTERGLRVEVLGLFAVLSSKSAGLNQPRPGQEVDVRITRMDADEGRIFVSDRLVATGQLALL